MKQYDYKQQNNTNHEQQNIIQTKTHSYKYQSTHKQHANNYKNKQTNKSNNRHTTIRTCNIIKITKQMKQTNQNNEPCNNKITQHRTV